MTRDGTVAFGAAVCTKAHSPSPEPRTPNVTLESPFSLPVLALLPQRRGPDLP